ncbi:thioesterase family protein [Ruminococcus sp. zg-924]|nr:thioesterase family protein [Ruminococcus sp. zg-924]
MIFNLGDKMISQSKIIVRYAETDKMGIVHHSNYPVWFEIARTDFIKKLGVPYSVLEEKGLMLPLVDLSCHYIKPAYYEDEIVISACVSSLQYAKIEFSYTVKRNVELLTTGKTVHGFVESKTFRPINVKKFDSGLYEALKTSIEIDG